MEIISFQQAKARFSQLLHRVAKGDEFIIAKAGKPVARLICFKADHHRRTGGQWKGLVSMGDDFDLPLPSTLSDAFQSPCRFGGKGKG